MARPADPHARISLVTAARAAFVSHGVSGARIEDITAACKLSKGAFYLHFKSKEQLFGELVAELRAGMDALLEHRKATMTGFFGEHGPLTARDVHQRTSRYEQLLALEVALDREVLGLLWRYRDVFGVLVSGSQGTEYSGVVWEMAHREVQRVQDDFEAVKAYGACRTDVPSELFGSMVVGTWLLVAQQMSKLTEPPDLDQWVRALHRLIREGSAPPKPKHGKRTVRRRLAARLNTRSTQSRSRSRRGTAR
ncbi:MAG: helix-turn-helix transcriptional regulator [Archangiaceae bacterium]|nr:helix-turn-helix transcriptional regulator [Archangiaceae bacterium]